MNHFDPQCPPAIGLIGFNCCTGLGLQNRDIATHLPVQRWLVRPHRHAHNLLPLKRLHNATILACSEPSESELRRWLEGLDWILFVENPLIDGIANLAKQCGVRVAAVCNWEWTCPLELSWLRDVDLMICPTLHALRIMNDWKLRYGFAWQVLMVPWPIDVARFKFRLRTRCEKFVFVNGTGGVRARRGDGSLTDYRRKGVEIVFAAARGAADVPIIVYSQTTDIPSPPPNVEVRQPPSDNRLLYNDGDVCVQPSHWEGVGMQLLECQAAGMPLVTTDAAPMNEHQPLVAMPVRGRESVQLVGRAWFESCQVDPADLAGAMRQLKGKDIGRESQKARQFIEQSHCWDSARRRLCQAMVVS